MANVLVGPSVLLNYLVENLEQPTVQWKHVGSSTWCTLQGEGDEIQKGENARYMRPFW